MDYHNPEAFFFPKLLTLHYHSNFSLFPIIVIPRSIDHLQKLLKRVETGQHISSIWCSYQGRKMISVHNVSQLPRNV